MAQLGGDPSDYWFQRPTESPLPAMQLGLQAAQFKVRSDLERQQLANQFARTLLVAQQEQAKLDAQLKQEQGFTELNAFVADTAKNEAWQDPARQSRFWDIAARYPQVMQGGRAELLYNRTFGAAAESQRKADAALGVETYRNEQLDLARERLRIAQQNANTADELATLREINELTKLERGEPPASFSQRRLYLKQRMDELQAEIDSLKRPGMFDKAGRARVEAERERLTNELKTTRQQFYDLLKPRTEAAPAPTGTNAPSAPKAAATPKDKAALANQLSAENPTWTRQQVIDEVNRRLSQ